MADHIVRCSWKCSTCKQKGDGVQVYAWPNEAADETAKRFARETRHQCLSDCMYQATVMAQPGAQAPETPR